MRDMSGFAYFVIVATWIAGVVLAKGAWSTAAAIFIPFWAWYLLIERVLAAMGVSA